MSQIARPKKPGAWEVAYSAAMGVACFISYWVSTHVLSGAVEGPSVPLGGMWAVLATVFVFKDTRAQSLEAGIARLSATLVSFALCLLYLSFFPPSAIGMAVLIGLGTLVMISLGRHDNIATTGITTAVVMVVAIMDPKNAWEQPILRLADTIMGIAVGVACKWLASFLIRRALGESVR